MSVRTMARVWELSQHSGTNLLMMLAIADFADDDGRAYPAVGTLAVKARMTPRNVNHILQSLRQSGELDVRMNQGPRGTNLYRIRLDGAAPLKPTSPLKPASAPEAPFTLKPVSATPETGFPKPLKPASDEPSLNHQEPGRERGTRADAAAVGSRLPTDWVLPEELRHYCAMHRPDLSPDATAEGFKDYWVAVPGAKGRKADWAATWRRWVREQRVTTADPRRSPLHADNVFEVSP